MAHAPNCLVLLYPYPDTVRRDALHKTLRSTFLTPRSLPCTAPRKAFGSAIADCRYRAPLTPRLSQYVQYSANRRFWQAILCEAHFLFLRETLALFFNMCYTDLGYNHIISDREIRIGISYLYFLAIGKVVPAIGDTNAGRVSVGARPLFWSRREILSFPLHIFSTCAIL